MIGVGIGIVPVDPVSLGVLAVGCTVLWLIRPSLLLIPLALIVWRAFT